MRPPVQRERGAVDEAPQVVVLVEVSDAVLHLVRVKVWLHVRDLDEGLRASRHSKFKKVDVLNGSFSVHFSDVVMKRYLVRVQLALVYWVGVLDDFNLVLSEALAVETLRKSRAEPH